MAGRDGFVTTLVTLPVELVWIVELYQDNIKAPTRNAAIRTILETHPAIAELVAMMYDAGSRTGGAAHGERVSSL